MTAQKSLRKRFTSLLATGTAALLALSGIALAPAAAHADDVAELSTSVTGGTADWGISAYLNAAAGGRPNPLPSAYVAPASFDATSRISTWGNGSGILGPDGSASLAFEGTSVNFAATGGGWLKLANVQAELDAEGNGVVSAVVSYGTAPGTYPNITFDPNQTPARGPERVKLVELDGNDVAPTLTEDTATWEGLSGLWHADFIAFLAGDESADPQIAPWSYAATVNNDTRPPSTFDFTVDTFAGTPEFGVFLEDGTTPVGDSSVYEGDKLVVKGSGFDPYANVPGGAGGVPIPNSLPQGTFVVFGNFADDWRPSLGNDGETRTMDNSNRRWLLAEDTLDQIPNNSPTFFQNVIRAQWSPLSAQGEFEWTVTIKAPAEPLAEGNYGIYTYAGGVSGLTNAEQELSVPINYQGQRPSVAASVSSANETGLTVDISAENIVIPPPTPNPAANTGAYVAVIAADEVSLLGADANAGVVAEFIPKAAIVDGAFSTTLVAPATGLDRTKEYVVVSWIAHGFLTETSFLAQTDLEVSNAQWDTVFPVAPEPEEKPVATTTTVKFKPTKFAYNVKKTATVTVKAVGSKVAPTGKVKLRINGKNYTATLKSGKAAIKLSTPVNVGKRTVKATYTTSDAKKFKNSSGTTTVTVQKARVKASASLVKSSVKVGKNAKLKVSATINGSLKAKASKFKVQIFDGKKKIKTVTLSKSGKATVTLPKLNRGTHKIKVKVLQTKNTKSKVSKVRTLKVVR